MHIQLKGRLKLQIKNKTFVIHLFFYCTSKLLIYAYHIQTCLAIQYSIHKHSFKHYNRQINHLESNQWNYQKCRRS